jgi:hypothetical protein
LNVSKGIRQKEAFMEASTRRLLMAAAALMLCLPAGARAQVQSYRQWRDIQRGAQEGGQPAPQQMAPQRVAPQQVAPQPQTTIPQQAPAPSGRFGRGAEQRGTFFGGAAQNVAPNQFGNRGYAQNQERGNYYRGGDYRGRDYRGGRFFSYRGRDYAAMPAPGFRYPSGWGYRSWARGEFLPRLFISTPYFIDYDWLGLPPPPYGYRWVRYGPDALLVNVYDGRILDVIYDAFY